MCRSWNEAVCDGAWGKLAARIGEKVRRALGNGLRKIEAWTERHGVALAAWPVDPVDPFFNVNTPEDAAEAERMAQDGA